jgi:hypothetical protein
MADRENWLNDKWSASSLFNRLAGEKLAKKGEPKATIITDNPDMQSVAEAWLGSPKNASFFERHHQKSGYYSLGYVKEVETERGKTKIRFLDQSGMIMGFDYEKGEPEFEEAVNGFKEGDIILIKYKYGLRMDKVAPVTFKPKTERKILRRFMDAVKNKELDV